MIYDDCSLFTALVKKKYSLAKFLIRKKIGIKYIKPQINETTLIIAAAQKYEDLALKIVKLGCDIKVVNNASSNALNIAISRDLFKLTKKLIELGCDVNFVESDKRTCLNCCRSVKMAKIIYEHGCRSFKYIDMNLDVKKFLVSVDPQIVINSLFETYEQDPEILNKIVSFKPQISDLKPQWFAEI
jgi:ankyrin repeat protein